MNVSISVGADSIPAYLTAGATFLAVAVALFGPVLHRWWFRPQLRIEFEPGEPFERWTVVSPRAPELGQWSRVLVSNRGRGTAHGCRAKVIDIENADGAPRRDRDPMVLRWSSFPEALEFQPLDLPPKDRQFVDVLLALATRAAPPRFATFNDVAPGFSTTLESAATHYLLLGVTCDEGYARLRLKVDVSVDGATTLAVAPSRVRRAIA